MAIFSVVEGAGAEAVLQHIIEEPANVVMVILGKPRNLPKILEVGIGRAEAVLDIRRVVHVPNATDISASQRQEIEGTGSPKPVVGFYGLRNSDDQLAPIDFRSKVKLDFDNALIEQIAQEYFSGGSILPPEKPGRDEDEKLLQAAREYLAAAEETSRAVRAFRQSANLSGLDAIENQMRDSAERGSMNSRSSSRSATRRSSRKSRRTIVPSRRRASFVFGSGLS
jgi:hypothetical protein